MKAEHLNEISCFTLRKFSVQWAILDNIRDILFLVPCEVQLIIEQTESRIKFALKILV